MWSFMFGFALVTVINVLRLVIRKRRQIDEPS